MLKAPQNGDTALGAGRGGEEEQDDDETVVETLTICSLIEAKTHVQELRQYFESCTATTDIDLSSISRLETAFLKKCSILTSFHSRSITII